jgi:hypothetical protein
MFESIPSYFHTNISFFVLLGIALLAAFISYLLYRRTIPPISKGLSIFLGIIRGIAISAIFLLIFAPELTLVWKRFQKTKTILALDTSASMNIVEGNQKRLMRVNKIAQNIRANIEDETQLHMYAFNSDTNRISENFPDTSSSGTDISKALRSILNEDKDPEAIILISDGNFTSGRNPAYEDFLSTTRIFTIGIGDTVDTPDLLIADVRHNKIVYQNKPTQVEVDVMMRGVNKARVSVMLKNKRGVLQAKQIELNGSGTISTVSFELIPQQQGLKNFIVELNVLEGETVVENNKYEFTIDVLKGKIYVGLIASQPNYDVKFLQMILSKIEDIELRTSVLRTGTRTYLTPFMKTLDSLEVLILHDIPSPNLQKQHLIQLDQNLSGIKIPVFIILNSRIVREQIDFVNNFFPLRSISPSLTPLETQVKITDDGRILPLLNVFKDLTDNDTFWLKCPPINYPFSQVGYESNSKILLQTQIPVASKQKSAPVLLLNQQKGRKSILLLGSGFWRWHFLLAEDRPYNQGWSKMLHNMIRWLGSGTTDENVIVATKDKSYQIGEAIQVNTQVYDATYNPVPDGMVRLQISAPSGMFEVESESVGNGVYRAKFVPISTGEYKIEAKAWLNDVQLGSGKTKLYVTPINNEFLYTKQDYRLLQLIAEKSGGKYFHERQADQLINHLDLKRKTVSVEKTFELWNKMFILLAIIFLLSLEWFIRKRKGLA